MRCRIPTASAAARSSSDCCVVVVSGHSQKTSLPSTGASTRSLRHYEQLKLIRAIRLENGYRHYSDETVEYVKAIRFLLCSGLSLKAIARILPALMNTECTLENPRIREEIKSEAARVKEKLEQLRQSYHILTAALRKGYIRRPEDR
ncbi:hypothetical protein DB346_13905 [Verrucomicrobia bacterium LW23]|nr:hypothetical protein DB346_13905 [Verrucomicrobia bacterium LW23]